MVGVVKKDQNTSTSTPPSPTPNPPIDDAHRSTKPTTHHQIVNLMAVDAQRLQDLMSYFSTLWSAPYQVCGFCLGRSSWILYMCICNMYVWDFV